MRLYGNPSSTVKKNIKIAQDKAVRLVKGIALETFSRVIMMTPVDTGTARANWNCQEGTPDISADYEKRDPGGGATVAIISTKVAGIKTPNVKIFLTNHIHYVKYLDKLHTSRQAAEGMTEPVARIFPQIVQAVINHVR